MAYGDWDAVIRAYKSYSGLQVATEFQRKFHDHSVAMSNLIPKLRILSETSQIIIGTSHGTLFFTTDNTRTQFCVWYEDREYRLYFYAPHEGQFGDNYDEVIVGEDNLISTIVEKLRVLISLNAS